MAALELNHADMEFWLGPLIRQWQTIFALAMLRRMFVFEDDGEVN